MRKLTLVFILSISVYFLSAQDGFWSIANEAATGRNVFANKTRPTEFKVFQLNENNFISLVRTAPSEKNIQAYRSGTIISFPDAEGKIQRFRIVDAPVMHADLAARYPGINAYAGVNVSDPTSTVRFSVSTQLGVSAMILSSTKPTVYIDRVAGPGQYYTVVGRNAIGSREKFECLTEDAAIKSMIGDATAQRNADDGRLRTYQLALCATGEFSAHWLNGTETSDAERKAKVLAALNNTMTATNAIFERDFAVRMVMVPNNDAVIYLSASSDPFTTSGSWNSQTQSTCDGVIGNANYDIGHMVTKSGNNGNAGCIGCVCTSGSKGRGWTAYSNPSDQYFVIDYLTHEMGHQFGGNHTFSFSDENTIAQVEPGSGSTIMGYAGITGSTDVQPHSDPYFHAISIQQVTDYIQTGGGSGCDAETPTGNNIPTANAGADFFIPRSTPFRLNGSGTDADAGDVLTYCWEQMNVIGTAQSFPSATATSGAVFRSFSPTVNSARTFPSLSSILSGSNGNTWEVLPSVARTLNFRFTVQDNKVGGGGNRSDDMTVTISSTTGPFAVTAPNTAVTWGAGTSQTVTWNVNGTNGSPVNCTTVNILLSTDGGNSFTTLLAGTANDGSEVITVPNSLGSTNRIKVEAVGNIFFDISNTNFTIGTAPACDNPSGLNETAITTNSATVNWSAVSGALNYDVDYKANTSSTWINTATGTTSLSANLTGLLESTLYDWRVRANCSGGSSSYVTDSFTTTAAGGACPGPYDVEPNGSTAQAQTIPLNTDVKGTIASKANNDYYRLNITTGGTITITLTTLPANYDLALLSSGGATLATSATNGNETINANVNIGTYYIRVYPRNNGAWNATSCYTLRADDGTASRSLDEITSSGRAVPGNRAVLSLFPNPATQTINVSLDQINDKTEIKVYNMMGNLVMRQITTKTNTLLNVSKLPAGVYMISTSDGITKGSSKFVKE